MLIAPSGFRSPERRRLNSSFSNADTIAPQNRRPPAVLRAANALLPLLDLHRHLHEFRKIARADPLHDPGAMILDGFRADL